MVHWRGAAAALLPRGAARTQPAAFKSALLFSRAVPVRSETVLPSSCELRGPKGQNHSGAALLGEGTLVGGDLLLSGQLELLSLRLDLDGLLGVNDALEMPPAHAQKNVLRVAVCTQTYADKVVDVGGCGGPDVPQADWSGGAWGRLRGQWHRDAEEIELDGRLPQKLRASGGCHVVSGMVPRTNLGGSVQQSHALALHLCNGIQLGWFASSAAGGGDECAGRGGLPRRQPAPGPQI